MNRIRIFATGCVLCLAAPAFADEILLKNGNRLEGEVVSESEKEIVLKLSFGTMTVKPAEIKEIVRKPVVVPKPTAPPPPPPEEAAPVEKPAPEKKLFVPTEKTPDKNPPEAEPLPALESAKSAEAAWKLLKALEGERGLASDQIAERLSANAESLPGLFALLAADYEDPAHAAAEAGVELTDTPAASLDLTLPEIEILVRALARFKDRGLFKFLEERMNGKQTFAAQSGSMRVLGAVGDKSALEPLLVIIRKIGPSYLVKPMVAGPFEGAMTRILNEDRSARGEIEKLWPDLENPTALSVMRSFIQADAAAGAAFLAKTLGKNSARDAVMLEVLAEAAAQTALSVDEGTCSRIETYLENGDTTEIRSEAALALGNLKHMASAPKLIQALSDEDGVVRASAHKALQALSGYELTPFPEIWNEWYAMVKKKQEAE